MNHTHEWPADKMDQWFEENRAQQIRERFDPRAQVEKLIARALRVCMSVEDDSDTAAVILFGECLSTVVDREFGPVDERDEC